MNTCHCYRPWLCYMSGFDRSNSLINFFQRLENKDKDTMRESSRNQGSDSNQHTEMERKRHMWERRWWGTDNVREDFIWLLSPQTLQWMCTGIAEGITLRSLDKAKLNESMQIRSELLWTKIAALAFSISLLHISAYLWSLRMAKLKLSELVL